jgi:hypothetical protein
VDAVCAEGVSVHELFDLGILGDIVNGVGKGSSFPVSIIKIRVSEIGRIHTLGEILIAEMNGALAVCGDRHVFGGVAILVNGIALDEPHSAGILLPAPLFKQIHHNVGLHLLKDFIDLIGRVDQDGDIAIDSHIELIASVKTVDAGGGRSVDHHGSGRCMGLGIPHQMVDLMVLVILRHAHGVVPGQMDICVGALSGDHEGDSRSDLLHLDDADALPVAGLALFVLNLGRLLRAAAACTQDQ